MLDREDDPRTMDEILYDIHIEQVESRLLLEKISDQLRTQSYFFGFVFLFVVYMLF